MTEETFGPVVGATAVKDDNEAVELMNDSRYGLTASIWTTDIDAAVRIGDRVETGTWFLNRCDYLDPAWRGPASGMSCAWARRTTHQRLVDHRRADVARSQAPLHRYRPS